MGEIVNLNRYRKALDKREREKEARENRAKHGRAKVEREKDQADATRRQEELDDKKLD